MPAISLKMRLLLFLYSSQNILGCVLALLGLGFFFSGFIADWWLLIVCGLYAVGWLLLWNNHPVIDVATQQDIIHVNLLASLDELMRQSRTKLPSEAFGYLQNIHQIVADVAPKLSDNTATTEYVISLTNAVTRDLPQTIKNYLQLPTAFATLHIIERGKTCKQLLLEQLDLLYKQLQKIAENVYKDDAEALITNGRFLEEKFRPVNFITDIRP
ncbi:hypothetical protein [Serratia sp. DD3]|uniref:hypothetical protein n=1 Tax=Serratia sp. DD3 TaxID=1410619 RepID=UPI0003C5269A|nr:hypothetical protein [Serratia sp. DD3]KEY60341.1 hypothetical protein SRDD_07160 [Serratia sp. DD3]